jgi:diguanylate cyclase (GGDEF)-like protein
MSPDQKTPDPKTPMTGISGKESVFDKKLREFRNTGQFQKPDRKALEYIRKPSAEFHIPATDSKLHDYSDNEFTETERMAFIDESSGFFNSRTILSKLANEVRRAARYHRKLSMMIIELDGLSEKEHLTNLAKEMLFNSFCKTLRSNVREVDILGRFDDSTLMIVCPETSLIDAISEAERLKYIISASHFKPVGHLVSATISVGVASYPEHGGAAIEVLGAALDASRDAVLKGGNQVCLAANGTESIQEIPTAEDFTPGKDDKAEFEMKSPEFADHQQALGLQAPPVNTPTILP